MPVDVAKNDAGRSGSTSHTLLERIKLRDPQAWHRFAALYAPIVFQRSLAAGLQPHDAADASQEVFKSVLAHVGEFRRQRPGDSFRGWLYSITRNKVRDHFRARAAGGQALGGSQGQRQLDQVADPQSLPDEAPPPVAADLTRRALAIMHLAGFLEDGRRSPATGRGGPRAGPDAGRGLQGQVPRAQPFASRAGGPARIVGENDVKLLR